MYGYEDQGAYLRRMKIEKLDNKLKEERWNKLDTIDVKLHSVYMRIEGMENNINHIIKSMDKHIEYCKKIDEERDIKLQEILNRTTIEKVSYWFK
tara:strand:- start:302 stop:586 length:285 start_codon:yes stop_codon:yes gene_type:complete